YALDTSACDLSDTAYLTITVFPNPTITATGGPVCNGACVNISANGGTTYTWNTTPVQYGNIINVCPTIATTYFVTGTDANGCTNTASTSVNMYTSPTITASGGPVCNGVCVDISANGGVTYTWNTSPVQYGATINVCPTTATNYFVTGTDANGCTNTASVSVMIYTNPVITATGGTVCSGVQITITANGGVTYTWDNNLGPGQNKIVAPTITTTYIVTGEDVNGCKSTASAVVNVNSSLDATPSAIDEVCENGKGSACVSPFNGTPPYNYLWSTSANDTCISNLQAGNYTVTVMDSKGCMIVKTITVSNNSPIPDGIATVDKVLDIITHNFLFEWNGTNGFYYHWDFGDGDTSNLKNPKHTYKKSGTYTITLKVLSQDGCERIYTLVVEVIVPTTLEVFNVFTPNSDNVNDKYRVKYEGEFLYFRMLIFNRWGRKLYETNDIDAGWKCDECSDGTYYYIITGKGKDLKEYDFHGHVTLIR
ncbi:MAG: gliding motility-associated C-terminal domain-containing protein, partial [Bacteroidales bacterium]|nr:gliding motility-associated C-terminal domain-containing protein [Bacteroidales bacterium]